MKIVDICDRIIVYSFYTLFFVVPLILTPFNYELFEYNKMMLVYGLTTIITGSWLIKMIASRQLIFRRTPFDLPITIYLITQLLSTIFSIDRHVSLFGYYSRFNGGLLSIISYLLLYYALVSNIKKEQVIRFLQISLLSAFIVSIYGILEHFGIDKDIWVQDVQNRVFSTLGQPNWLAAYLAILLPISIAFVINPKSGFRNFIFYFFSFIFYLCLLFTKSRSGLLGFGVAYLVFWFFSFLVYRHYLKTMLKPFIILSTVYCLLSTVVGTPWTPRFQDLISHRLNPNPISPKGASFAYTLTPQVSGPALETGGTESGEIRKIVWQGALDIARHYPLFGSGVETFAFSYYQFRPQAHNLVSEWDFLYNKAHNEYLNYAATTGFIGLGAYLLLIGWFIVWSLKKILREKGNQDSHNILISQYLNISLFTGWLSILVTNFFGFSVVPVAIYFWLIPAMCYILITEHITQNIKQENNLSQFQKAIIIMIICSMLYVICYVFRMWYADTRFNQAYQLAKANHYENAYELYLEAIGLNPGEPFYRDELANTEAILATAAWEQKETTLSSQLAEEAMAQNKIALTISPLNVNFWKTRTKVFYTLANIDEKYNEGALESILTAQKLAPTDAKITYNLGLLYGKAGNEKMAIKTLEDTVNLKPNYQDARYALALYYNENGQRQKAIDQLKYVLEKISTDSADVKEKLKEWGAL